jgi:hypothetical protein
MASPSEPFATQTLQEPIDAPMPSQSPEPGETPTQALELGDMLYSTEFKSGWTNYADESTRFSVTPDGYLIDVGQTWAAWQYTTRDFPSRCYVETTAQAQVCPGISSFGLIFRYRDNGNLYALALNCTGGWELKLRKDGEWFAPVLTGALTPEQFTGVGGLHRIGLYGDGTQLTVFYNGEAVGTVRDETFRDGDVGVYVEAATDELTRVLFEQLIVWALP